MAQMVQLAQMARLEWREPVRRDYADLWTPEALAACEALAPLDRDRRGSWRSASNAGVRAHASASASTFSTPTR